jgi:diguanylate cyclase (GGDEF)-like protein
VKLGELSVTDELTGLKNRRFLDARLGEEFARARRYSDPLALVMIDLDHFKRVNDGFGHPAGDLVLREAAARIRGAIRDPDVAARYGGEEFAVLLPKAHLAGAVAAAERIWTALGTTTYPTHAGDGGEPRVKVTASVGLACFPSKDVMSPDLLVAHADQALYDAKRCGRNAICLHQGRPYQYVVGG